jgi:hypothetical protein
LIDEVYLDDLGEEGFRDIPFGVEFHFHNYFQESIHHIELDQNKEVGRPYPYAHHASGEAY